VGLVFAGIWLVFSALPLPGTTILGLPFLGIAIGTTVISLVMRRRRAAPGVLRWAVGALAVTGLGCLWQVVMLSLAGGHGSLLDVADRRRRLLTLADIAGHAHSLISI